MSGLVNFVIIFQHALIGIIGSIGNAFVIMVYKKKLKSTIDLFIIHLAETDLFCCLFLIPLNCYHELKIGNMSSDFMCKFHSFFNIINITYSCQIMTLVAFERYFSICYNRKLVTIPRAKFALIILFLMCLVIGLFGFLSLGTYHEVHISDDNVSIYQLSSLSSYNSSIKIAEVYERVDSLDINQYQKDYNSKELENFTIKASVWISTTNCFPNNRIISIKSFEFIRSSQNFLLFINFTLIFINYVLIFIFVSRRRNKKMKRKNYFQSILNESRLDKSIRQKSRQNESLGNHHDFGLKLKESSENITFRETELAMTEMKNSSPTTKNNKSTQTNSIRLKNQMLRLSLEKENSNRLVSDVSERTNDFENSSIIKVKYSENLFANLKTAFMLFVVTIIMAIVYTPALLTSLGFIDYNPIHWNIIYINNAANPIVYSFMNIKFRNKLQHQIKLIFK